LILFVMRGKLRGRVERREFDVNLWPKKRPLEWVAQNMAA